MLSNDYFLTVYPFVLPNVERKSIYLQHDVILSVKYGGGLLQNERESYKSVSCDSENS